MEEWRITMLDEEIARSDASVEEVQWRRQGIYRVPKRVSDLNSAAYKPQTVSLGPFYYRDSDLEPMEEHKRRAFRHLVKRSGKPLRHFFAALQEVAEDLWSAYTDLPSAHKDLYSAYVNLGLEGARDTLLVWMLTDGCFVLEVMRIATGRREFMDYSPNDPVFSEHGIFHMAPYVRRDMLILENQLPLLLLKRIVAVEMPEPQVGSQDNEINQMVQEFVSPLSEPLPPGTGLRLHYPLDVHRSSMLYFGERRDHKGMTRSAGTPALDFGITRSAVELYAAGIRFRRSKTESLRDIRFQNAVLSLPKVTLDGSTEHIFLNMLAFERLHAGASNDVAGFVFFLDSIIHSAKDVALLRSEGIIQNLVGSDNAAAKIINAISRNAVLEPGSLFAEVYAKVHTYRPYGVRTKLNAWLASLVTTYFRSPWTAISLVAAAVLLVLAFVQTVYTIVQFYRR